MLCSMRVRLVELSLWQKSNFILLVSTTMNLLKTIDF